MQDCAKLLARFNEARVLVVGDVFLDENVYGVMAGISLEAPIPIYEVHERRYNPGAAGNCACNVAALGAATCMVGVVGDDANADIVRREFAARNVDASGLVVDAARPTNTYGKFRAGGFNIPTQEVLRVDTPRPPFIEGPTEEAVIAAIHARASEVDAIVVVDQISSVATDRVLAEVAACGRQHHVLTVGDSRLRAGAFDGFDVIVPNDHEAGVGAGIDVVDEDSLHEAARILLKGCKTAMVTRGPKGITYFTRDGETADVPITINPGDLVDVTGAGDTVTAAVALSLVVGGTLHDAAFLGNVAAGVAVRRHGVVTVSRDEVVQALHDGDAVPSKLKTREELKTIVRDLQKRGRVVVWTNGCFDLLHSGHVSYLLRAAQFGDILVVGLNSDASVRANKGPSRPVVSEAERARLLAALECVDYITIFSDKTTVPILRELRPDVYAKGGDYTIDTINQDERHLVEGYGGRIELIRGVEGLSTSNIIDKILQEGRG